ncbi:MAG: hypothetical protein R2749_17005 [Acidimicrobiales bacterium]
MAAAEATTAPSAGLVSVPTQPIAPPAVGVQRSSAASPAATATDRTVPQPAAPKSALASSTPSPRLANRFTSCTGSVPPSAADVSSPTSPAATDEPSSGPPAPVAAGMGAAGASAGWSNTPSSTSTWRSTSTSSMPPSGSSMTRPGNPSDSPDDTAEPGRGAASVAMARRAAIGAHHGWRVGSQTTTPQGWWYHTVRSGRVAVSQRHNAADSGSDSGSGPGW